MTNVLVQRCFTALAVLFAFFVPIQAATFTVAKDGSGQFTTIMAAMRVAQAGDIIQILDVATYNEQVTIDSTKNGLTLTSRNPTSPNKPKIVWQDRVNVGPRTCAEAKIDSMINFDRNGALQVLRASNITINGIAVDGGGVYTFGYPSIWAEGGSDCRWPLQHGNAAIALWISGDVLIKNCDLSNAFFGIAVKDRNEGGIFGNANPADIQPWNVVPLSGFAKTGNHVIEYNRIHNNVFGMFFESVWDMGSTIRYNLIYENHYATDAQAQAAKQLTTEGANLPGGAFMFKDHLLSPLSIYNNTCWHNTMVFCGAWRGGGQHLIFNNIFATPHKYWRNDAVYGNAGNAQELWAVYVNRMYNCLFSCYNQPPEQYSVQIGANLQVQPAGGGIIPPGNLVTSPYPASANVRWLEMGGTTEPRFLSTDPASANFLMPDWEDSLVIKYIKDQGWQASGVRDQDGSWADIGARPAPPNDQPPDLSVIKPTMPVLITGNQATVSFNLTERAGRMTGPAQTLFRFVSNVPFIADAWGYRATLVIPAANIINIPAPAAGYRVGANSFTVTLPSAFPATTNYAFFELITKGTGSNSKEFTSATGFLPYRKLDYKFVVEVLKNGVVVNEVRVGDTVMVRITAYSVNNVRFTNTIKPVSVDLISGLPLLSTATDPMVPLTLPNGVVNGIASSAVMFTRVPPGGYENIRAAGSWTNPSDPKQVLPFIGTSAAIKILPGPPESVVFQNPPSVKFQATPPIIDPGVAFPGLLYVYDRFGNRVDQPTTVNLSSLSPTIGDIVGTAPVSITTDATGAGNFQVQVTNGRQGELFKIRADLPGKQPDTAILKVGAPRDRLWIFYSDTAGYDPNVQLRGTVGERLPVVIMCGKSAKLDSVNRTANFTFSVTGATAGLEFYATAGAATPATSFTLVNGRATVWVTGTVPITNGKFAVIPDSVNTVLGSEPRENIYFIKPAVQIDSAFYYTDNGFGRVDRVEVYFKDTLSLTPDSMVFYWPSKVIAPINRRVAAAAAITLDPANKRHVTVSLAANPFPDEITSGSTTEFLGTTWNRSGAAPTLPAEATDFKIQDRVGPLAMRALLVERIGGGAGTDTLFLSLSESIVPATLVGNSLILKKAGTEYPLAVSSQAPGPNGTYLLVVTGTVPPAAGDSLRLAPGVIADSTTWQNKPHANNRPVPIVIKPVPAPIVSAWYKDIDADGNVDRVFINFAKDVTLTDCIIALDWGLGKLDTAAQSRLSLNGGSSVVVDAAGLFSNLNAVKTSGTMRATVSYLSIPGEFVFGTVADSAAPVLVDTVRYYPGKAIDQTNSEADTVVALFSEPIAAAGTTPFKLFAVPPVSTEYIFTVVVPATLPQNNVRFVVNLNSLDPASVGLPRSGDSVWINPAGNVTDAQGNVQLLPTNRRVPLKVILRPSLLIALSSNPFSESSIINIPQYPSVNGQTGMAIVLRPIGRMGNVSNIKEATAAIYDAVGNPVVPKTAFTASVTDNIFSFIWDGRNQNGRTVGNGTYLAVITYTDLNGVITRETKRIGVKR